MNLSIPPPASVIPSMMGIYPGRPTRVYRDAPKHAIRKRGTRSTAYSTMFAYVQRTPR